jgi:hypothetical protein
LFNVTGHRIQLAACVGLVLAGVGCAEKEPAVFDRAGMDGMDRVLVLPIRCPQDAGVGQIISGLISARLQEARYPRLSVVESPVLHRLVSTLPATSGDISPDAATRIARGMGADAVLVGVASFGTELPTASNVPKGMEKAAGAERTKGFLPLGASVSLDVQIISTKTNRLVYAHAASAKGSPGAEMLSGAIEKALEPLEKYMRSSRK